MIKRERPFNRESRRFGANPPPIAPAVHIITIARLHAENDRLRKTLSDIDALVVDFNHQRTTFTALLVAINGIRRILREWKS